MALLGFISLGYVHLHGGELNGPVIGGILTVVGFGAFGKHIKNVIPILMGVTLMGYINDYDMSSNWRDYCRVIWNNHCTDSG